MTGAISGARNADPFGASDFTPGFSVIDVVYS